MRESDIPYIAYIRNTINYKGENFHVYACVM